MTGGGEFSSDYTRLVVRTNSSASSSEGGDLEAQPLTTNTNRSAGVGAGGIGFTSSRGGGGGGGGLSGGGGIKDLLKQLDRGFSGGGRRFSFKRLDRDRNIDRDHTSSSAAAAGGDHHHHHHHHDYDDSAAIADGGGGGGGDVLGDSAPPEWALLLIGCLLGLATGLCVAAFNRGVCLSLSPFFSLFIYLFLFLYIY